MTDHWEMFDVYKALLALAAGIILGLERELKDKSAGLKTMTVICLGSALFAIISYKVGGADGESTRIASYIVSGVGFLGAGVIFKDGLNVSGLTTAGIIWLSAAIGTSIGFGEFFLAATFIIASLFIIYCSPWLNTIFRTKKQTRNICFTISKTDVDLKDQLLDEIRKHGILVEEKKFESKDDKLIVTVEAIIPQKTIHWLETFLVGHRQIVSFEM